MNLRHFLACIAVLAVPAIGWSQTVTPSETQLRYNNEGVLKMQESDYTGAIARFQSSLTLGDLNITYLNLGRSYYRLGRCLEAEEAFAKVSSAPKVTTPSPPEIAAALEKFRADLQEWCTGTVVVVCEEPANVVVGDSNPRACTGELAWPVVPGEHTVRRAEAEQAQTIEVAAGEAVRVELAADDVADAVEGAETGGDGGDGTVGAQVEPIDRPMPAKDIFGWMALSGGGVLLLSALMVDLTVVASAEDDVASAETPAEYSARVEDLESQRTLNKIVLGSGVGLTVVGAALLLWPDPEDSSVVIVPEVGRDSVGARATLRW